MSENSVGRKRLKLRKKLNEKGMFYGDNLIYILIHNTFSVLIFFSLTLGIGLFSGTIPSEGIWSSLKFFLDVAFISFVSGVMGRALGTFFMHFIVQKIANVALRSGKDYSITKAISYLTIGIIGLISIVGGLEMSYYIFGLLALLFLAVNKFENAALIFLIASLISSFLWIVGMLSILQTFLFTETTIWTAIGTYFIIKLIVYISAKIIVDSRL